ncbi:MAG: tetratricopeptide repeat protein [bacterium]
MKYGKKNNKIKQKIEGKENTNSFSLLEKISKYGYFLIILVVLLLYSQTVTFDFTGFEDDYLISKNYKNLSNIENLDDIFFKNSFLSEYNLGFYRPMQTFTYMFDALIVSNNPVVYHTTNLFLHCLVCSFIFLLFIKLKYKPYIALSAALLYSVHPLFVHAVVWLPSRGDLLLALFSILSFIFLIIYCEKSKLIYFILHIFSFLLAGLSKETALLFPVLMFFWYFILNKKPLISKEGISLILSWLIIISLCYAMRLATVEDILSGEDFGIVPFFNNLATIPEVIGKFIIPINIQVMPNFNVINTSIGLIVITVIIVMVIYKIRKTETPGSRSNVFLLMSKSNSQMLFGLIWFAVLVLPGLFYARKFTDTDHLFDYQDHRNYLPMIGFVIILIELLTFYLSKIKTKSLITTGIVILLLFSSITFFNSRSYKDSISFFNQAIEDNPKISGLYFLRAGIEKEMGRVNEALLDYTQTIRYNPKHADAYNNRASLRAMYGNYQSALKDFNMAIKLNPGITESYYNRAVVRKSMEDLKGAIEDYSAILNKNPNDYIAYNKRGLIKLSMNVLTEAIKDFSKAIEIKPDFSDLYFNRGTAYLKYADNEKAIDDFETTFKLNPNNSEAYLNCGIAKYRNKNITDACTYWHKAFELGNGTAVQMIDLYCK